jgi:hypothetical protein
VKELSRAEMIAPAIISAQVVDDETIRRRAAQVKQTNQE